MFIGGSTRSIKSAYNVEYRGQCDLETEVKVNLTIISISDVLNMKMTN
jgi:hypothetical protein